MKKYIVKCAGMLTIIIMTRVLNKMWNTLPGGAKRTLCVLTLYSEAKQLFLCI